MKLESLSKLIMESAEKEENFVTKFGCLMLEIEYDNSKIISVFEEDDLCKSEGGICDFKHVTILYGLHTEVKGHEIVAASRKFSNFKNRNIDLSLISLFKNSEYDVVKFDVMESEFYKLNKIISKMFPFTNKYKTFHAHSTIAYVNPGLGDKYITKLRNQKAIAKAVSFTYKDADGKKTISLI